MKNFGKNAKDKNNTNVKSKENTPKKKSNTSNKPKKTNPNINDRYKGKGPTKKKTVKVVNTTTIIPIHL